MTAVDNDNTKNIEKRGLMNDIDMQDHLDDVLQTRLNDTKKHLKQTCNYCPKWSQQTVTFTKDQTFVIVSIKYTCITRKQPLSKIHCINYINMAHWLLRGNMINRTVPFWFRIADQLSIISMFHFKPDSLKIYNKNISPLLWGINCL